MEPLNIHFKDVCNIVKKNDRIRNHVRQVLYDIANYFETEDFMIRKNWEDNIDLLHHDITEVFVLAISITEKPRLEDKIMTITIFTEQGRNVEDFIIPMSLIEKFDIDVIRKFYG